MTLRPLITLSLQHASAAVPVAALHQRSKRQSKVERRELGRWQNAIGIKD